VCYYPGGFRCWWRQLHHGSEQELDNAHLMRMAGRFSRRVRGYAKANGIPIIDCGPDDRKHEIAEEWRLRIEVVLHNAKELRCGRLLEKFPPIVTRLKQIANQFLDYVYAMDATFISDDTLDELPRPSCLANTKIGGIDINKPRTRTVLNAVLSLACAPRGFTVSEFAASMQSMGDPTLLDHLRGWSKGLS
jgi:hypothetical protein